MWIVEQLSSRTFYHYLSFWSTLLVKMCPIFDGSASNHFTRYQKILWVCSLECKKLLNFICLPMKFHNRHHVTPGCHVMMPNTFLSSLKHMWQHLLVTFVDLAKTFWSDLAPWGCLGGSCCAPGGPGSKLRGPCHNLIIVEQNFKGTFFDSMNGLAAHKGQRRTHTHTQTPLSLY